jgi:hypothetical protein
MKFKKLAAWALIAICGGAFLAPSSAIAAGNGNEIDPPPTCSRQSQFGIAGNTVVRYDFVSTQEERLGYADAEGGEIRVFYYYSAWSFFVPAGEVPVGWAKKLCEVRRYD